MQCLLVCVRACVRACVHAGVCVCSYSVALVGEELWMTIRQIGDAGINLRGASAAVVGKRAIFNLAFDSAAKAASAVRSLRKLQ